MTAAGATLVGRYRLIEPVGRGGMAEVWRGEDLRLRRPVAVKLINTVRGDAPSAAQDAPQDAAQDAPLDAGQHATQAAPGEVLREARDAARLVHPNVVGVYDAGVDNGRLFIVMEWVAGRDLATVLSRHGPLPPVQVAWIGAQTAWALAAAHAAGIVHRDVKPANLMLTRADGRSALPGDGVVKLADFGIAARIDPDAMDGLLDTGPLVGTTAYVSPEQVLGRPAGPSSDLYGLGCALYELLVGRPPFTGDDPAQVVRRHLAHEPVPPSRLVAAGVDVPAPLERLILRLLTKDAASRPADAAKVAQTLESLIASHRPTAHSTARSIEARRPTPQAPPAPQARLARPAPTERLPEPLRAPPDERSPDPAKRRRPAALIAAPLVLVALIAVALAVAVAWGDGPAHRSPALAVPAPTGSAPTTRATTPPPRVRRPADVAGPRVRIRMSDKDGKRGRHSAGDAKDRDKRHGKDR